MGVSWQKNIEKKNNEAQDWKRERPSRMGLVNPAERYEYRKAWQERNKDKCTQYWMNYKKRHPKRTFLVQARARAKKNGVEFSITEDDFDLPEFCPATGIKLTFNYGAGAGGKIDSYSLDRIDNSKGYIPGNVRVLSRMANMMKSAATKEQLQQFAKWVLSET